MHSTAAQQHRPLLSQCPRQNIHGNFAKHVLEFDADTLLQTLIQKYPAAPNQDVPAFEVQLVKGTHPALNSRCSVKGGKPMLRHKFFFQIRRASRRDKQKIITCKQKIKAFFLVVQTPHPMGCRSEHHTPWDATPDTTPQGAPLCDTPP